MVPRVRVALRCSILGIPARMCAAGVSDIYGAFLDAVAGPTVRCASIDGVLVVEASAGRVEFNKLVTHCCCAVGGVAESRTHGSQQGRPRGPRGLLFGPTTRRRRRLLVLRLAGRLNRELGA